MVLLAVRMVADVTETRIVIPSLEFKTCMTIKSYAFIEEFSAKSKGWRLESYRMFVYRPHPSEGVG